MNIGKKNKYARTLICAALVGSLLGSGAIAQAATPEPLPPVPALPAAAPVAPVTPVTTTVAPIPTKPAAVKKTVKKAVKKKASSGLVRESPAKSLICSNAWPLRFMVRITAKEPSVIAT